MKPLLTLTAVCLLLVGSVAACDLDTTEYRGSIVTHSIYILSDSERVAFDKIPTISMEELGGIAGGLVDSVDTVGFYIDTLVVTAVVDCLCCPGGHKIGNVIPFRDTLWFSPDTTRFYAKVDTVKALMIHFSFTCSLKSCAHAHDRADTTYKFDTTWLPKVQVWMDSVEYKCYQAWHDNLIWYSGDGDGLKELIQKELDK